MTELGNPPPVGTPLDSPEWEAGKKEVAAWYVDICDSWAIGAFRPLKTPPQGEGSVPSVPRKR